MNSRLHRLPRLLNRVSKTMGFALAQSGFEVSLIPGLLKLNINFRAGGRLEITTHKGKKKEQYGYSEY